VATPETPEDGNNRLKWGLGSEASPRDIAEFTRRFGCPIFEGYGSSENAVILLPGAGMPAGAMGQPPSGIDAAIIDPVTGEECARAEFSTGGALLNPGDAIGEIVGRNTVDRFEGYYNNPEADAERAHDGWYWSGDLGYRDVDGWIYFAGRSGDWLRVDGENFSSAPIERILARYPGLSGVAVYAAPDAVTGDQVMAALELEAGSGAATRGFDSAAFLDFVSAQPDMGTKWTPRYVRIVDSIPVTATRKVNKHPLRTARWETDDPVWWRPPGAEAYRLMTDADRAELRAAFAANGREAFLR
jgi:fatty-acyl-CoA synthase